MALGVSFILTLMVVGAVVDNLAKHHNCPFHVIEGIEWPFMILFFLLAGSQFNPKMVYTTGLIGITYIVLRLLGRVVGGWLGSRWVQANYRYQRWIGLALLPQAGLAIGMALIVNQTLPRLGQEILPIILVSTIIFEIFGPILTRKSLVATESVKR